MKSFLFFLVGCLFGVVCMLAVPMITADSESDTTQIKGLTLLEQPAGVIPSNSFEVRQVLSNGCALAKASEKSVVGTYYLYTGMMVLFMGDENTNYYDDQIITVPRGKCARQIGTYKYHTSFEDKTVPVVGIFDK